MAISNKTKVLKALEDIRKKQGEDQVYTIDDSNSNLKIPRISTGIEQLDAIIGGGLPKGRLIEISGAPSHGKTTLLYYLLSLFDPAILLPIEGTFNNDYAKIYGNVKGQLNIVRTHGGEDSLNKILKFTRLGAPFIALDSIPFLRPKADREKLQKAADKDTIERQRVASVAGLLTDYLPEIQTAAEQTGSIVFLVNQLRAKMNAMPFGEQTHTPGGFALEHCCSMRWRAYKRASIKITNKSPMNSASYVHVGFILKIKVDKSNVCNPLGECEIPIFYDRGLVNTADVKAITKEIQEKHNEFYSKKKNWQKTSDEEELEDEWEDTVNDLDEWGEE